MTEPVRGSSTRPARRRALRTLTSAFAMGLVASPAFAVASSSAAVTEVKLAQYKRIHRFPRPSPRQARGEGGGHRPAA